MVVIHYTAMADAQSALDRLCDPVSEVSAHYLIGMDGTVFQMVEEPMRAWHAGAGQWGDVTDVNSRSIGIELDNTGSHPFSEMQMRALECLLADIMDRWTIPPERVIGHSDMAPARKSDPGARFDWQRLARQGLSVWPDVKPSGFGEQSRDFWDEERLCEFGAALRAFGYPVPDDRVPPPILLHAFCARFAGFGAGASVLQAAKDLAARYPVDRDGSST